VSGPASSAFALALALWACAATPPSARAQGAPADSSLEPGAQVQEALADSSLKPDTQAKEALADSSVKSDTRAEEAPADSSLHQFLQGLSDSTDRYFGLIAAPLDTAGLDSALAAGLENPWRDARSGTHLSYGPVYGFNRVDGTLWGASAALSSHGERWRVGGDLGNAAGSDRWLGGGEVRAGLRRRDTSWRLRLRGGRRTASMDRDHEEPRLAAIRALVWGSDRQHYLRRDGFGVAFTGDGPRWHAGVEYRDMLESPLAVTTRWNLTDHAIALPTNLAAAFGRTRELALEAGGRWPGLPLWTQVTHQFSDRTLGSDFDYRRTRVALGGELALGAHLSFLPQLVYGRLGGDAVPQASFYLGGMPTLRSLPGGTLGGTGLALARLDVIGADDLLAIVHLPHPSMLPIQGGLFVATGAVWGADPFGGPGTPATDWPEKSAWLSEAGASLLYRPGIPEDDGYFRLNYAHPLGNGAREARWSVTYSRALDLLRPF
jgi:hypothetical protein